MSKKQVGSSRSKDTAKDNQAAFSSLVYRITGLGYLIQFSNMELPPLQSEMHGIGEIIRMIAQELEEMRDVIQFSVTSKPFDERREKK